MSYCTNCGTPLEKKSNFCNNCGHKNKTNLTDLDIEKKISNQSSISDTEVDFDDRERFKMDKERIEKYFRHLTIDKSIYLEEDIPDEKLKNFSTNFKDLIVDNSVFCVYYDDSTSGTGNEGFAIVRLKDEIFFLFSASEEGQFGTYLKDVKKVEYLDEYGIIFTVRGDNDEDTGFVYKSKNIAVSMALLNFIKCEYNWFIVSSEEEDAIMSMINFNSDDEEEDDDKDNDPLGLRGDKTSTDNNDPLGLRN